VNELGEFPLDALALGDQKLTCSIRIQHIPTYRRPAVMPISASPEAMVPPTAQGCIRVVSRQVMEFADQRRPPSRDRSQ
jgi:hypothetical protein